MNIVSLLPSATEICTELDLTDQLVGVSHDCDWPEEIQNKPVLSSSSVPEDATGREIDQAVKSETHKGKSIYHVDSERLRELDPDLILTQELCEVCAPSFDEVREAARLLGEDTRIVSLEPSTLDDILDNIKLVGSLTDREKQADELCRSLQQRRDRVEQRAPSAPQKKLLNLEWLDPPYLAGHWVPEMVEIAGGIPMNDPGAHSYEVHWEDLVSFDPDQIVLMPCGFGPERTKREFDTLLNNPPSRAVPSLFHSTPTQIVHGSYYFNRPGPRTFTGLEIIARILYPSRFEDLNLPDHAIA